MSDDDKRQFMNDVAAIVKRNLPEQHVLLSQRYGIAAEVWEYVQTDQPTTEER